MSELSNGKDNLWSFLLLCGYLKPIEKVYHAFVLGMLVSLSSTHEMVKKFI
ncbi:hypothetical protein [Romboutsia sp.]|uniref:hypothetical protein n=1 Tax=Romboutsia sp. TaxID=1965302 RepID=UPI003F31A8E0